MARKTDILLVAVVLLNTILLVCGTKFLVTLPKKPQYDSEIVATVTAVGVPPEGDFVTLSYTGAKDTSRKLNTTQLEFRADGVQRWGVVFPWKYIQELQETGVVFVVGNQELKLQFNEDTGYIFIQTDKPIYTPRQKVRFRIIAVDEYQRLSKYQIKVDIKNPKGIIVDRMRYAAEEAFKGQYFDLPREATHGFWSISANFEGLDNSYSKTKTVEFEVKEYVLPRFSAELEINTDVVTRDTEWISLFVSGKYVYGRPVQGQVEIQLGMWDDENGVTLLPHRYSGKLKDGKFRADSRMTRVFPTDKQFPTNKRLYVSVNVTEEGTGENDTIVDTSTFLSHPYYVVNFDAADQYVKPGFPYTLKADVKSKSGIPTPNVDLSVLAFFKDKDGNELSRNHFYRKADARAKLVEEFDAPEKAEKGEFVVSVLDWARNTFNSYTHKPLKLRSVSNEYIHIEMLKPIRKRTDGSIRLLYTKASTKVTKVTKITVQVLSKGQVVYMTSRAKNSDGRSVVKLPKYLYPEVAPSMRIVVFYYSVSHFVMDSLLVDTDDICLDEVTVHKPGGTFGSFLPYKPKAKYEMEVTGAPYMRVGLVALDQAVLLLNDRQTLTRESFFKDLESHDQGKGEGDGGNFETVLENSGLEHILFDTEVKELAKIDSFMEGSHDPPGIAGPRMSDRRPEPRPQTIRNYFPESWLFEERQLPRSGHLRMDNLTLPDSITTWNFMAVGLSRHRGICVSRPLLQQVQKLFFADVRLPFKVTRLEEVKVKIAIYNYQSYKLNIKGIVTGSDGLCFSANAMRGQSEQQYDFDVVVPAKGIVREVVKVIPLKNGDLTLRVDLAGPRERDVVERKLNVVAEGLRVHKSITFVLDPEAKHVSYKYKDAHKQKITMKNTATINNIFDVKKKEQNTTIDLALPVEVIRGTESCGIAAFGDLMGDIITHAVVESKSLVDQPMADAEEVLGDLGPTVHALLYVNHSGLADEELTDKGRRFIGHSVARLLKYREGSYFRLTPKSKPATWLTATVLKTLCFASKLTFVDQETLIDAGFTWLYDQVDWEEKGTVKELDWRLSKDSLEYSVMLSADVLIAVLECERYEDENHQTLTEDMAIYLEDNIQMVQEPMVLAKAAYALLLYDPESEITRRVADRLWSHRRQNDNDNIYWSDVSVIQSERTPFWYQLGAKSSSIEATAYALLVFLQHNREVNTDAIADWLVGQRNGNGAFIGALDSMAAIQALSSYSLQKRERERLEIDLSCNVSSEKATEKYKHSFKFTQQDATSPKSVNDVPVGHKLEVLTKGQGLGQMHVNVEYNIPVDKNAHCLFNVTVDVKNTQLRLTENTRSDPLCFACNIGCDDEKETTKVQEEMSSDEDGEESDSKMSRPLVLHSLPLPVNGAKNRRQASDSHNLPGDQTPNVGRNPFRHRRRERRSADVRSSPTASKRSICIQVCLQYLEEGTTGPASVELEMLTGYRPVTPDVERIFNRTGVRNVEYIEDRDVLVVQFDKIASDRKTCFALRAIDEEEVGRPTPANVVIKEAGLPQPSCWLEYNPPPGEESLQVFCADFSNDNRGECRCYSGLCSSCYPMQGIQSTLNYYTIKKYTCDAEVVYEVELTKMEDKNQWVEIDAKVLHNNMTGSHEIGPGDSIKLITPSSCSCPHFRFDIGTPMEDRIYLLSPNVEKMVDRTGKAVYRYLLDEKSNFLRTTERISQTSAINIEFLKNAIYQCDAARQR